MAAFYDLVLAGEHPTRALPAVQREALVRLCAGHTSDMPSTAPRHLSSFPIPPCRQLLKSSAIPAAISSYGRLLRRRP